MLRACSRGLLCAALFLGPVPAFADATDDQVEAFTARGAAAYAEKDYEEALRAFAQAYALRPTPDMAYNIARVHEALKHYGEAERYYRLFIDSPEADVDARRDALKRLTLVRELASVEASTPEPEPEPAPSRATGDPSPAPAAVSAPSAVTPLSPEGEEAVRRGPHPLGWVLLGAGGLALGSGVTFGVLANQRSEELSRACAGPRGDLCPESSREDAEAMRTNALVADISYTAGAALVVTSVIVLVATSGQEPRQARRGGVVAPMLSRGGGGLSWSVTF